MSDSDISYDMNPFKRMRDEYSRLSRRQDCLETKVSPLPLCECGVSKTGGIHSSWCLCSAAKECP